MALTIYREIRGMDYPFWIGCKVKMKTGGITAASRFL
jgi:hypothetical protein